MMLSDYHLGDFHSQPRNQKGQMTQKREKKKQIEKGMLHRKGILAKTGGQLK